MIEAADHLTYKHFGKFLGDKDVNILDPATGTGTFITEIIEYLPRVQLRHKYKHELFCNEVALLPYYTANLNIEYTYQQKMGEYVEFENIAFVDTLENLNYLGSTGQFSLFEMTAENLERIRRQNEKKISVIIGNPPYNANQLNENENNKNRPYPFIDERIKNTYVKESTAQKTKVYDMYSRFLRWASDRVGENGVVAFIVNRSFVDSRTYDGFRKVVAEEFGDVYVLDLGGDVRANPKLSGTKHNVFGIQTGVAMLFLVKKAQQEGKARIYYVRRPEMETAKEKLAWLAGTDFERLPLEHVVPDRLNNWINQSESKWDDLLPLATKETKLAKSESEHNALFELYSLGIASNRDDWVYDFSKQNLAKKIKFFCVFYESERQRWAEESKSGVVEDTPINDFVDRTIKWTGELEKHLLQGTKLNFDEGLIQHSLNRPFVKQFVYYEKTVIHRFYQQENFFRLKEQNANIIITISYGDRLAFSTLASHYIPNLAIYSADPAQSFALYRYDKHGNRLENITNWGLKQFREHYKDDTITRKDIFHYVYGVLHDPAYRTKFELNLKREFPRVPFYGDFARWAAWGERLMDLHLNYESVEPYDLARAESDVQPKARLKADKAAGRIDLDGKTVLTGVPAEAWDYKLGNRSALEWVLDRYKETKPKDPTIRERFNTYRFADYKEDVIELLRRVTTVSVETVKIVGEMERVTDEARV